MSIKAVSIISLLSLCLVAGLRAQTISSLLPLSDAALKWRQTDSVRVYTGMGLFGYINGGAEIFMENGFNAVAATKYTLDSVEEIQVEVYDMKDSAAAFSTYTSYINADAKSVAVGTDAIYLGYYMVFWKAHYVGVLSAVSVTDATQARLLRLAAAIAGRIPAAQARPALARLLLDNKVDPHTLRYCKGRVGLSNFHVFSPSNAFDFHEAVAITTGNDKVLITLYPDAQEAAAALSRAKTKFAAEDTTLTIVGANESFSFTDSRQVKIDCSAFNRFNIIIISPTAESVSAVKKRMQAILKKQLAGAN
jgi:hypothetical protein